MPKSREGRSACAGPARAAQAFRLWFAVARGSQMVGEANDAALEPGDPPWRRLRRKIAPRERENEVHPHAFRLPRVAPVIQLLVALAVAGCWILCAGSIMRHYRTARPFAPQPLTPPPLGQAADACVDLIDSVTDPSLWTASDDRQLTRLLRDSAPRPRRSRSPDNEA
jgi:hypothetical protein